MTNTDTQKQKFAPENFLKTADLTSREFFQTLSGANRQNIRPKPQQNTTKKHKTNTNTQKQKFAPENIFKQRP